MLPLRRVLCLLLLSVISFPASAGTRGDLNGDQKVTLPDVTLSLRATVGLIQLTAEQKAQADVHPNPGAMGRRIGDGAVTVSDALRLLRYVVGALPESQFRPQPWVTTYAGYGSKISGIKERDGPAHMAHGVTFSKFLPEPTGSVLFVGDYTLRRWNPDGSTELLAGKRGEYGIQDGPADQSLLNSVAALAWQPDGGVLIMDSGALRRYDPQTKQVATLAGQPIPFRSGTKEFHEACQESIADGPAMEARLGCSIFDMTVGPDGTVYFTDAVNDRLRTISPDGTVRTHPASKEKDEGPAIRAPRKLAVDPQGNLWVSEYTARGNLLHRIGPDGRHTVVAGGGDTRDDGPAPQSLIYIGSMVFGPDGNLYFSEGHRIRLLTPDGQIVTVAGSTEYGYQDGPGREARFWVIHHIRFDAGGNLLILDALNGYLRHLKSDGTVDTLAPGVPGIVTAEGPARHILIQPQGMAFGPDGSLYFSSQSLRIQRVTPDGKEVKFVTGYPAIYITDPPPEMPSMEIALFGEDIAVAKDGTVYATQSNDNLILSGKPGEEPDWVAGQDSHEQGHEDGPVHRALFDQPFGVAVDSQRGRVYVSEEGNRTIRVIEDDQVWTLAGVPTQQGTRDGKGKEALFYSPKDLEMDEEGNLYVADGQAIRKVTPEGEVTTLAALPSVPLGPEDGMTSLQYVALAPDGTLYATGFNYNSFQKNNRVWGSWSTLIYRALPGSKTLEPFAGHPSEWGFLDGPASEARFLGAGALAVDKDGNLYVSDRENHVIRKIEP